MAENKRFVMYEHKDNDYILDTLNTSLDFIEMLGDALDSKEIVDRLNKQNMMIKSLEKQFQKQHGIIKEQDKRIIELEDKLNQTALEFLNHEIISMRKAVEISEMNYSDFIPYCAEHSGMIEKKEIRYNYTGYQVYIDENGKVQRYGKDNDETRAIR